MGQTEIIALWIGLISSIVGIVLSIVAIIFAVLVEKSSRAVSEQMIKSLQKIESEVERSSDDTRELIKVGWNKMLGSVDSGALPTTNESASKSIAAGIASELRAELGQISPEEPDTSSDSKKREDRLDEVLRKLETTLTTQLEAQNLSETPSKAFERIFAQLNSLSPEAKALIEGIKRFHLELSEYQQLRDGPLGAALDELRDYGLLVPVSHKTSVGKMPCYYFPPTIASSIRAGISLLPATETELTTVVENELERIGYVRPRSSQNKH